MQRPLKLHKYHLKLSLSEDDMKYMTAMARERFDKITTALRQMPKNLLLVIRYVPLTNQRSQLLSLQYKTLPTTCSW